MTTTYNEGTGMISMRFTEYQSMVKELVELRLQLNLAQKQICFCYDCRCEEEE